MESSSSCCGGGTVWAPEMSARRRFLDWVTTAGGWGGVDEELADEREEEELELGAEGWSDGSMELTDEAVE